MGHAQQTIDRPADDTRKDLTIRGSDDFLADQGIEDTDEFRVKTHLCHEIASIVEARNLTQAAAAEMTGQKQSDVSRIINYRHDDYSVWRLMKMLSALGADILITVNPSSDYEHGVILSSNVNDRAGGPENSADKSDDLENVPGMRP
jgi:predicted XRE-type DNA-binding protein